MMLNLPARMLLLPLQRVVSLSLLHSLILKIYRNSFESIYSFGPSVHADDTWRAVKKYITDIMKGNTKKNSITETRNKDIDFQKKKNKQKGLFSDLISDDFADDPKFVGYSNINIWQALLAHGGPSHVFHQLKNTMSWNI